MTSFRQPVGVNALLDQAGDAVARGDWTGAREFAEAVLQQSHHHPEAELILRTVTGFLETEGPPNDPFAGSRDLRFMSLMFCDVVGSTGLIGRLGDTLWRNTLERFRRRCARVVRRYDGYVHEASGDEMLILFGYPRLREDDARRAVLAGLDIITAIDSFATLLEREHGVRFRARIGIHTGRALIREHSRDTAPAGIDVRIGGGLVGEAAHIAKRIEACAEPNTVWVSDATRRIVERLFEFADPPVGVKHIETSVGALITTHQVIGATAAVTRRPVLWARSDEMVGRHAERERLLAFWARAKSDGAPFVLITGNAGIGKSRLVEYLADTAAGSHGRRLECICSEMQQPVAFAPMIALLERFANIRQGDDAATRLQKLGSAFYELGPAFAESIPYLAWMMSIPGTGAAGIDELEPEAIRKRIFGHLVEVLRLAASIRPLVFWIEDLQWADHSTLEFCQHLEANGPLPGLLAVATMRTGYASAEARQVWPEGDTSGRVSRIHLGPLSAEESREMIAARSGTAPADAQVQAILDRTGGNPLYIEEVLRSVSAGDGSVPAKRTDRESSAMPASLQPIFAQIVDRLGADRQVAQMASLLGRELPEPLTRAVIAHLLGLREDDVVDALARLTHAEIVEPLLTGLSPGHRFRHELIRQALEHSVGPDVRDNHGRIGHAINALLPDYARDQPAVLAYHFTKAEEHERAAGYRLAAGASLQTLAAHEEAIASFDQGLESLTHAVAIADANTCAKLELSLVASRGVSLQTIKGYANEQAGKDWARAYELARQLEARDTVVPALGGVWSFYFVRGEYVHALDVATQMTDTARVLDDAEAQVVALTSLGYTLYYRGEMRAGRASVEESQILHDRIKGRPAHILLPQDPGLAGLSLLGPVRWSMGDQVGAQRAAADALALASALEGKRAINLSRIGQFNAWLHQISGSYQEALRSAEQALAVATAHRIDWAIVNLSIHKGLAMAALASAGHDLDDGLQLATTNLGYWRASGTGVFVPYFLGQLGEVHHLAGNQATARELLDEAMDLANCTGEHCHDAELHRVRGQVTLALPGGDRPNGADDLLDAIAIARSQGAVSFEIRAIVALLSALPDLADRAEWTARLEDAIARLESSEGGVDERRARALIAHAHSEHRMHT
jgi:class 3 adenylate cyclase/predicted ATPase